jgi:hypothetical protein
LLLKKIKEWLTSQGKTPNTLREILIYAKRFGYILDTGDASPLLTLSSKNRQHALTALANLSKYQGRYDQFLQLRQRYNIKWSKSRNDNNSIASFELFFNPNHLDLDAILLRIKEMIHVLPDNMAQIIKFACLTGLRPSESCEAVRLLNSSSRQGATSERRSPQYYNPETQTLEHFRFPDIFLRTTKKAFISFITLDNLQRSLLWTVKQPLPGTR